MRNLCLMDVNNWSAYFYSWLMWMEIYCIPLWTHQKQMKCIWINNTYIKKASTNWCNPCLVSHSTTFSCHLMKRNLYCRPCLRFLSHPKPKPWVSNLKCPSSGVKMHANARLLPGGMGTAGIDLYFKIVVLVKNFECLTVSWYTMKSEVAHGKSAESILSRTRFVFNKTASFISVKLRVLPI